MHKLTLALGLFLLCRSALCDDLTLDQFVHNQPRGLIGNGTLGDPQTIQCQLDQFPQGPPEARKPGAIYVWINAIGSPKEPGMSALNGGILIDIRSPVTIEPHINYTFEGYESGELLKPVQTDPAKAVPPLRYHPFFVVTKVLSPADAKPIAPAAGPALPLYMTDGNYLPLYRAVYADATKSLRPDLRKEWDASQVPTPEAAEQLAWTQNIHGLADYENYQVTGLYHIDPIGKVGLKDFAASTDWIWEVRLTSMGIGLDGIYLVNAQTKKVQALLSIPRF